jgi:hypothetical protein
MKSDNSDQKAGALITMKRLAKLQDVDRGTEKDDQGTMSF